MIKFHPSSVGKLMTDAQSIDRSLVPADLLEIASKPRKTDSDREKLAPYKELSLSDGAKTELKRIAKEFMFCYHKVVDTKFMEKGNLLEEAAIEFLSHFFFQKFTKNTERRENKYLTGECDIWVPSVRTIDTKVPWSLDTFPLLREDAHDPIYEWQGRGYMSLWDVPEHMVAYVMFDTPDDLRKWEQPEIHSVGHLPQHMRLTTITYQRDMELERKMYAKLEVAQQYLLKIVAQATAEHQP